LLKELHRIVNEAIRAAAPGDDQQESRFFDLSQIDLEKLRDEFAKKCKRKATALQDVRQIVEEKLAQMLARNPQRMDFYKKYSDIIADYNREKDRVTIEETFAKLVDLANSLDAEQRRAAEEGLSEEELALFDLLTRETLSKVDRERVKQASRTLLEQVQKLIEPLERWTDKEQTQAEVRRLFSIMSFRICLRRHSLRKKSNKWPGEYTNTFGSKASLSNRWRLRQADKYPYKQSKSWHRI
jgi:type I restriction enzyme R subunit